MKEHTLVTSTLSSHRRTRPASPPTVTTPRGGSGRLARRIGILSGALGGLVIAAALPMALAAPAGADAKETNVNISLTPQGCTPKPAKVSTGQINFNVANKNAGAVSEAELRTKDLSHILGEQENLTPGLSGGFALVVQPGHYVINCPGASQQHAVFTVTGKSKVVSAQTKSLLTAAASGYTTYVNQQVAGLVTSTQTLCTAINSGNQTQAEQMYAPARVFYEHIEPVAEVWGTLDTAIDGRIDNPVTNPADLRGFHRIEEIMWADDTLTGAAPYCSQLVTNEQQLQTLVSTASYNAVTMASGATDLINEAANRQDHGRRGALLEHRLRRLPGQRRRCDGGVQPSAAATSSRPIPRSSGPDQSAVPGGGKGHRSVQGDSGLRQHRLRGVLPGPRPPTPRPLVQGPGVRRGPLEDVGAGFLTVASANAPPSPGH